LDSPEFYLTTLDNGWTVGRFHALDEVAGILHAVTTKQGLDVQLVRNDHAGAAAKLAGALGWSGVAFVNQVHGGVVLPVEMGGMAASFAATVAPPSPLGGGFGCPTTPDTPKKTWGCHKTWRPTTSPCHPDADGLVTDRAGLGLMTRGADCPLILAVDPVRRVIGTAHASWRGTACRIAEELVGQMAGMGAAADRIIACICPSAGPCCYEVGRDVLEAMTQKVGPHAAEFFRRTPEREGQIRISGVPCPSPRGHERTAQTCPRGLGHGTHSSPSPFFLDLWSANKDQLLRAGLRETNIHISGICTMCANEVFPSHRREGAAAGRFAAVIGLGPVSVVPGSHRGRL
jgi:YfiH family protein